ncbi:MAG: hypothetical protein UX53_C0041G0006 [Candidatus Azambacteria bacterium GW2011_GWB2_46_37]|uniref:Uncharacterized protein n=1 Tax=Candidatus Azambacteria bacterium GW2011_GWB2_46_37 TaxID=1618618 RepID=A0A0G1PZB1_9BACT|nr:MAG: hypothetical protein UX53_C0041G0006 [Candidatus Azambacteria bacterium GW2011_GWB2_46_37]
MFVILGAIGMVAVVFLLLFVLLIRDYLKLKNRKIGELITGCILGIALLILALLAISVFFSPRATKTSALIGGEVEILLYQVPQKVNVRLIEI